MEKGDAAPEPRPGSWVDVIPQWWMPVCFFASVALVLTRDVITWVHGDALTPQQWRVHLLVPFQGLLWWAYNKAGSWF